MKTENDLSALSQLNMLAAKIYGLGYLIVNCATDEPQPLNMEEIYWGIGMILSEIGSDIRAVARRIDEKGLDSRHRKRRRKSNQEVQ